MKHLFLALALMVSQASAAVRVVYGTPSRIGSLNPYLLSGIESFTATGFVIEPLARIEPFSQELQPWLALSWSVDAKRKIIRVKLRSGVTFHNGQALTAEDVRFTWKSYFDPAYKGDIWRAMWDQVEDVKAVAPDEVEFKMKELHFQVFQNIMTALRVLPREYYGKVNHQGWASNLVGSGPFKVERFDPNRSLNLVPNPNWWGWKELKIPVAPSVLIKTVNDVQLAEQMVAKKGELDIYQIPSGGPAITAKTSDFRSAFGRGFSLGPNFRMKALQNVKLRKALLLLWNRKALNDKVYAGRFKIAVDSFSAGTTYYPKAEPAGYDPEQAKKILRELGYNIEHQLSLRVLVNSPENERWVGLYQADAAKVGVKIVIEKVMDESQWWQLVNQGKFELVAYDGSFSEKPHPSVWHSKGAYNSSGLNDVKLDQMLDQLEQEFDHKKRVKIQAKLIQYLREIHAEIPGLFSDQDSFLLSPEVTLNPAAPLQAWRWSKKD